MLNGRRTHLALLHEMRDSFLLGSQHHTEPPVSVAGGPHADDGVGAVQHQCAAISATLVALALARGLSGGKLGRDCRR